MTTTALGVAAWLLSWANTAGEVDFVGTSSEAGAVTEGEAWFTEPVGLVIPQALPLEESAEASRVALLVWSLEGGNESACAYVSNGDEYELAVCDGPGGGQQVEVDYVAVWSDVERVGGRGSGDRILIDFTGGGVVLHCGGVTHYLGDVDVGALEFALYCPNG